MADLLELGVVFVALAGAGALAARLGKSVIPFYVLAGTALSTSVSGRLLEGRPDGSSVPLPVETSEFITLGAELGIVFLLFFLGLEFNLDRLIENRRRIGEAGVFDLVINFGVGLVLGWVFFSDPLAAVLVAGIVYISSSAIVTKSLIDIGWIANDEAEPMLGTLVFEDLFIAFYLAVAVAALSGGTTPGGLAGAVALAVGFLIALFALVRFGSPAFERLVATGVAEHLLLRVTGVTVLIAGAALAAGVSEAVAAFFVGTAFSTTDDVRRIEGLLEPLRDVFAAVFFFWIGLNTDPALFPAVALPVAIAVALTTPAKLLSGYLGGRAYDLSPRRSIRVGLGLVCRGEFSLIIATVALGAAALPAGVGETLYAFTVGYVLVMSLLGTLLMEYSGPFERALTPGRPAGDDPV